MTPKSTPLQRQSAGRDAVPNGAVAVSHTSCNLKRDACLAGRRWTLGLLIGALTAVVIIAARSMAADRVRSDDHERRLSRMEASVEANTERLRRIEANTDRLLEMITP